MKVIKVSKQELERIKKEVKELSNEDLDKIAGGGISPCPDMRCTYRDNYCVCPDDDDI